MSSATITVRFGNPDGSGTNGHLSAEIDTRPDGLNGGASSFEPGANVAILVYRTDNVRITHTVCSAGSLAPQGQAVVSVTEDVTFMDSKEARLRLPAISTPGVTWFGRALGGVSLDGDRVTLKAAEKGVAVARVTYQARAEVYRLQSPPTINGQTDFTIAVFIAGAAA